MEQKTRNENKKEKCMDKKEDEEESYNEEKEEETYIYDTTKHLNKDYFKDDAK